MSANINGEHDNVLLSPKIKEVVDSHEDHISVAHDYPVLNPGDQLRFERKDGEVLYAERCTLSDAPARMAYGMAKRLFEFVPGITAVEVRPDSVRIDRSDRLEYDGERIICERVGSEVVAFIEWCRFESPLFESYGIGCCGCRRGITTPIDSVPCTCACHLDDELGELLGEN